MFESTKCKIKAQNFVDNFCQKGQICSGTSPLSFRHSNCVYVRRGPLKLNKRSLQNLQDRLILILRSRVSKEIAQRQKVFFEENVKMSQQVVAAPPAARPKSRPRKAAPAHPKFLDMVKEAIGTLKDRNGSSRQAICKVILGKYPSVNPETMNSHVRKALKRGLDTGALTRPARSSATGATGRFKLGTIKPVKPAKKKASKKRPAKKRPAKKAGAKKAAKPKTKSPRKKATGKKKPATASKKAAKAKTKRAASPKKKAKPAAKKAPKKPRAKKAATKKPVKK